MASLLNSGRPPVFCPGCSHDRVIRALDEALQQLDIPGDRVVIVSDIGCSGLFDVFFHTHAFHGLHGRALTYGLGLKMADPTLHVIVTMGDGGTGIGGAHILSGCRRNCNMTLLLLNNFNFGMTGGQYSPTTPADGNTSSRFLNQLEAPLDLCQVADAAGAPFITRCSGLEKNLADNITAAIAYEGFSLVDIWGICPGRYSRKNRMNPADIARKIASLEQFTGVRENNERAEYSREYYRVAALQKRSEGYTPVEATCPPPQSQRLDILFLGRAGQRIVTAGELLCLAAHFGGLRVTQKNDYDITVLKGPSVSEIIYWPDEIGYTAIEQPQIIIALAQEGVQRRRALFSRTTEKSLILCEKGVDLPHCSGKKIEVDFGEMKIVSHDRALAALAVLAKKNRGISRKMLKSAVECKFSDQHLAAAMDIVQKVYASPAI